MNKIYGNRLLLSTVRNMIKNNHTANSVIIFGEKGSGKKLTANYYANMLLCENPYDGYPCGMCSSCRNFLSGNAFTGCLFCGRIYDGIRPGSGLRTADASVF